MHADVSIIIPAYNAALTIQSCVGSALNQTYLAIEVIVVDDASNDDTAEIVRTMAGDDNRLRLFSHDRNSGEVQARRSGVQLASGEYILFLDADDSLEPVTCEYLIRELRRSPADILHFSMLVDCQSDDAERNRRVQRHMEGFLTPLNITLCGAEIARASFAGLEHSWGAAGKLFRAALCKQAYELLGDANYSLGGDLLAYFYTCCLAKTYRGCPDSRLYRYNYGAGGSNPNGVTLANFRKRWLPTRALVADIEDFCERTGKKALYAEALIGIRKHFLNECMDALLYQLDCAERQSAFFDLAKSWSVREAVASLAMRAWRSENLVAGWLFADITSKIGLLSESAGDFSGVTGGARKGRRLYYAYDPTIAQIAPGVRANDIREQECFGDADQLCFSDDTGNAGNTCDEQPILLVERHADAYILLPDGVQARAIQPKLPCEDPASYPLRAVALAAFIKEQAPKEVVLLNYSERLIVWDVLLFAMMGVRVLDASEANILEQLQNSSDVEKWLAGSTHSSTGAASAAGAASARDAAGAAGARDAANAGDTASAAGADSAKTAAGDYAREYFGRSWAQDSYKFELMNALWEAENKTKHEETHALPYRMVRSVYRRCKRLFGNRTGGD